MPVGKYKTHYGWKGTKASYKAKHIWIINNYGKADHCEENPLHLNRKYQWSNISGEYKREVSDYRQLCISCHVKFDYFRKYGNKCKKGHEFTYENTYLRKDRPNARVCRACQNIRESKRPKRDWSKK